MWSKEFWVDVIERALATFVQTFLGLVSVAAVVAAVGDQDWASAWNIVYVGLASGAAAALFSVLKSLGAAYTGAKGTAQLGVATYDKES